MRRGHSKPDTGFFAVSLDRFYSICDRLGMNECCLYLIYCCGSDQTNTKTSWSVNALSKYTAISVRRGQKAAKLLAEHGHITKTKAGKHPKFTINRDKQGDSIWLPKTFVLGAVDEIPPLELLRRTGDQMTLRLVLDLYWQCDVAEDGGIRDVWESYDKTHIAAHGQFDIFGFKKGPMICNQSDLITPHVGEHSLEPFWLRLQTVIDLGLIYPAPTLFDSPEGEIVTPLIDPFDQKPISNFGTIAKLALPLEMHSLLDEHDLNILVQRTMKSAVLKGVYILKYRQSTSKTAAGYAKNKERICLYQGDIKEVSKRYQRGIKEGIKEGIKDNSTNVLAIHKTNGEPRRQSQL